MSRFLVLLCVLSPALLVTSQAFSLPTPDELFKMVVDKEATVKTMQADSACTVWSPVGPMKGTGKIYTSKTEVDGKVILKSLMTIRMTVEAKEMSDTNDMKTVNDGKFIWQEMRNSMMPTVQVVKMRVGQTGAMSGMAPTPEERVEQLKSQFDFGKVSEDSIDGRKMYILKGALKAGQPGGDRVSLAEYYVDQDTLGFRRMVMLDKAGKEFSRFDITNVKLNVDLDPKLFQYTPPPGAEVQDKTGQ